MSNQNEISEYFKNLVADKKDTKVKKESSYNESDSESDSSISSLRDRKTGADIQQQQRMIEQQRMMEQQRMIDQQRMFQQQQAAQQAVQQGAQQGAGPAPAAPVPAAGAVPNKVEVAGAKPINKVLSVLGVLFALFFILGSSQVSGLLNMIPYLESIPFSEYINLFIRSLLFVLIFFVLDTFVL
jgi:hypothetical protein